MKKKEIAITTEDISPELVLNGARKKLKSAVLVGYEKDGSFYFASSQGDSEETLDLLKKAISDMKYWLKVGVCPNRLDTRGF